MRLSLSSTGPQHSNYGRIEVLEAFASGLARLRQALPIKLLVLYGPYTRGDSNSSDKIDLLVVYDGPARDDACRTVHASLGIPGLDPHVYSQVEYAHARGALDAIVAKGMVLYQEGNAARSRAVSRARMRRLRWIGNGLLAIGVLMVFTMGAYYAYSYYSLSQIESFGQIGEETEPMTDVGPAQAQAEATAADESPALASFLASAPGVAAKPVAPPASTVGDDVPWEGIAYGPLGIFPANRIIIPAIEVDSRIIELGIVFEDGEWQWERPVRAVGHLKGTSDPGQGGNNVMSGHMSSPVRGEGQVFNRLPEIKLDDVIILNTPVRSFAYQVVGKKVVLPSEVSVLKTTGDETLTLITCVPDLIYSHRLIVTAKRVSALH